MDGKTFFIYIKDKNYVSTLEIKWYSSSCNIGISTVLSDSILLDDQLLTSHLEIPKNDMDSSKNGRWIILFKKFSSVG